MGPLLRAENERRWLVNPAMAHSLLGRSSSCMQISQARYALTDLTRRRILNQVTDDDSGRSDFDNACTEAIRLGGNPYVRLRSTTSGFRRRLSLSIKAGRGALLREFETVPSAELVTALGCLEPAESVSKVRHVLTFEDVFPWGEPVHDGSFDIVADVFEVPRNTTLLIDSVGSPKRIKLSGPIVVVEVESTADCRAADVEILESALAKQDDLDETLFLAELTEVSGFVRQVAAASTKPFASLGD